VLKQRCYGLFFILLLGSGVMTVVAVGAWFTRAAAQDPTPVAYPIETVEVQSAYPDPTVVVQEAYPASTMDNFFLEDGAVNTTAVLIGAFILVAIVSVVSGVFVMRKRKALP